MYRRAVFAIAIVPVAISVSGCGSSRATPRPLTAREQIENVCGTIRTRLTSIYARAIVDKLEVFSESPVGPSFQHGARESAGALDEIAQEVTGSVDEAQGHAREALLAGLHSTAADFRMLAKDAHQQARPEPLTSRQEHELLTEHRERFSPGTERLFTRYLVLERETVRSCFADASLASSG